MATQIKQDYKPFFKSPRQFPKRGVNGMPIGPRTEERQKQNRELNKLPDSVKRRCELRIPGRCQSRFYLGWAHSKKSRFLTTDKDWQTACRACLACHQTAEAMSHKEMHRLVTDAIKRRKTL